MTPLRNILYLTKREFFAIFYSPIAFIVATAFLSICGFTFYSIVRTTGLATMRYLFDAVGWFLVFIIPILTMRTVAEEKKSGTLESLLTLPVSEFELVVSKFFATWLFYLFLLLPTLAYVYFMNEYKGNPDMGETAVGYLGISLLGAVYISFGILCSSLVRDQIISATLASIFLMAMWQMIGSSNWMAGGVVDVIRYTSFPLHLREFDKGVVDTRALCYFLSLIFLFNFLTMKVVESNKWK